MAKHPIPRKTSRRGTDLEASIRELEGNPELMKRVRDRYGIPPGQRMGAAEKLFSGSKRGNK